MKFFYFLFVSSVFFFISIFKFKFRDDAIVGHVVQELIVELEYFLALVHWGQVFPVWLLLSPIFHLLYLPMFLDLGWVCVLLHLLEFRQRLVLVWLVS